MFAHYQTLCNPYVTIISPIIDSPAVGESSVLIEHRWLTFLLCCIMHIHNFTWHYVHICTLVCDIAFELEMAVTTDATWTQHDALPCHLEVRTRPQHVSAMYAVSSRHDRWSLHIHSRELRKASPAHQPPGHDPGTPLVYNDWLQGRVDVVWFGDGCSTRTHTLSLLSLQLKFPLRWSILGVNPPHLHHSATLL